MRIGYHCSHEQHAPSVLLENAVAAQRAGFTHAMCSDHFAPWSEGEGQGQSGFAWSWLGSALQATEMSFGTVTAPGQRYHPAILAQAIGTLAQMYRARVWAAVGTGEALNEHITGDAWPAKNARRERLRECVEIMRALLRGETVTHSGHVRVHEAKLATRPSEVPALYGAALTPATARWCGAWADGLITTARKRGALRELLDAFRDGGGDGKPIFVQAVLAYAASDREAEQLARAWAPAIVGDSDFKADIWRPAHFEAASKHLPLDQLRESVCISASAGEHVAWIGDQLACGADRVYVHHLGASAHEQQRFLAELAPKLLSA